MPEIFNVSAGEATEEVFENFDKSKHSKKFDFILKRALHLEENGKY